MRPSADFWECQLLCSRLPQTECFDLLRRMPKILRATRPLNRLHPLRGSDISSASCKPDREYCYFSDAALHMGPEIRPTY